MGEQRKKLLITFLVYGINMICDILATYSYSDYIVGGGYHEVVPYITVFLISICEFIIEKYLLKKRKVEAIAPYWITLITIPIISIVILFILLMNNLNNRIILIPISAGILYINMLIFYLYDILLSTYLKIQENLIFERQIASYSHQLDVMMESEEKIKGLRHDMIHYLNEIAIMANRNSNMEISNYIARMHNYMDNPYEYSSSGNKEVDSLINYMLDKARKTLGNIEHEIYIPKELNIATFDLNIIVGNLLENSIYAAKHTQEQFLKISLEYDQKMLFIRIQNSYQSLTKKYGDTYLSTKEGNNHGIGLQNVKRVVQKYNGEMIIADANNMFDVKIILYTIA